MLLRRNKILISLVFALGAMNAHAQTTAKTFVPSTAPIFNNAQAKPNIHMVLDDSGSMKNNTDTQKVDMFDDKGRVIRVDRNVALEYAINKILLRYRDKAFLGTSLIYQPSRPSGNGQVHLLLDDYSQMTDTEFLTKHYAGLKAAIKASPGNTPIRPAVYDALKMFRGMPVSEMGNRSTSYPLTKSYKHEQLPSIFRYRCQQNHIIMMTDGEANTHDLYGIAKADKKAFGLNESINVGTEQNDVDTGATIKYDRFGKPTNSTLELDAVGPILANIAGTMDLRDWAVKLTANDITGNPWKDANSRAMPITIHSVSLHVDPKHSLYTQMTNPTMVDLKGMNLGFGANEPGDADALLYAFDTIFSSIIRSTSSTLAVTDRDLATSREGVPGVVTDLSEMSTLHYDTTYNFRDNRGSLRATQTYHEKDNFTDPEKKNPVTKPAILWTTDTTIKPNQGRFVTTPTVQDKQLRSLVELNSVEGKAALNKVYTDAGHAVKNPSGINDGYIKWMMDFTYVDSTNNLRGRSTPLGSVTNSDVVMANKDVLNINVNKDKMSKGLRDELVGYLKYKSKYQPTNLVIVGDNDGFISFINAQRGLTGLYKAGERRTAYFPKFQAAKIDDIAKANREAVITQESKINLVDAKVNQPGLGDVYATIGLSSMGSGAKAIVGYRVYGETLANVNKWNSNKTPPSNSSGAGKLLSEVTPLFEIVNEKHNVTSGFKDLGYTYSGFEFFNHEVDKGGVKEGQAVAIFGNGFGVEKSVVYFIDAYTGEKLHEIILSPHGGGAATPTAIIEKDAKGQKISYLYVGDYSGTMYRVKFGGASFQDTDNSTVTALFKAPTTKYGQSAISVKPLVVAGAPGIYSVYFGTGVAASQDLDRGENSLVQHRVYGIFDQNITEDSRTTAKVSEMNTGTKTLQAALTVNNITEANVKYKDENAVDYTVVNKGHELEISVPTTKSDHGWSIKLTADGDASGERTIYNPVFDKKSSEVVFATWGIIERDKGSLPSGTVYDPCIVDEGFGKSLYLALDTGKPSSKKGDNQGTTNTPSGTPEGRNIIAAPLGNDKTDIADLSAAESEEVIDNVGKDNSSYVQAPTDPNQKVYNSRCYLDNLGVRVCDGEEEGALQLLKKRVSQRLIL